MPQSALVDHSPDSAGTDSSTSPSRVRRWIASMGDGGSPWVRWCFFLGVTAAIVLRRPQLWRTPRFWEEEGWIYFPHALHHGTWEILSFLYAGYLDLSANIPALAAVRWVPIEEAPLVTTTFALGFQLIPYAILCFSRAPIWTPPGKRLLALLLLLTVPLTSEVWLNSTTSKFHLSLGVALLLVEESTTLGPLARCLHPLLLGFAGLSSPVSLFLAPLFFLKAWRSRQKSDWIQFSVLALAGVIQGACVLTTLAAGAKARRGFGEALSLLPAVVNKCIIPQFFGVSAAGYTARFVERFSPVADHPVANTVIHLSLLAPLACYVTLLGSASRVRRFCLGGAAALLLILSYTVTSSMLPGRIVFPLWNARYFFAPNALSVLLLLEVSATPGIKVWKRRGSQVLISLALVHGVWGYKSFHWASPGMPVWRDEVKRWRADPTYQPWVWPMSRRVNLNEWKAPVPDAAVPQ